MVAKTSDRAARTTLWKSMRRSRQTMTASVDATSFRRRLMSSKNVHVCSDCCTEKNVETNHSTNVLKLCTVDIKIFLFQVLGLLQNFECEFGKIYFFIRLKTVRFKTKARTQKKKNRGHYIYKKNYDRVIIRSCNDWNFWKRDASCLG